MSSSSTSAESFVPGRKLLVHIAENGHSFQLECNESTTVEEVQRFMESLAGIHVNDQLLLCLDMKLESQRPLSAYKLPSNDREVFLYNRARLLNDSPAPVPEQVDIPEIAEPPFPVPTRSPHALGNAKDPALFALPGYEQQFRYHFQRGRVIFNVTSLKFENCERLLKEQKVQERALETARGSMDHYYHMIQQMYVDFMKCYSQQHRYHTDLLANCARDIEKLRSCKLHPSLQTETRRCLLDFVKEENLWKWAENCNSSHKQFETKVSQLKQMFNELKRRVEDLFSAKANVSTRDLELMINQHQRYLNEQKSIMQSLSKDVNTVKKLVDDCVNSQLPESIRPSDAVSALGPMYEIHDKNHLPKMEACDSAVLKLLDFCRVKKDEMNIFVHNCMQKVAYVQYIIRDVRLQFPAFKEAMARQDDLFADLKFIRGIGSAYRACLAEVVRRKASMKLYMGMAGQLAERLAVKREAEVRRREEFIKAQSAFIPRDILSSMGLFDTPNQCDVNISPFDTNLLEIDIADIDRYAPDYFVTLPFKAERRVPSKDSFSMSNDGYQSAEAEECSVVSSDKYDLEGLHEDCDSVVIAGTSKLEVENARLKAELASAIALICAINPEIEYESLDDSRLDSLLKNTAEKTAEALHLKDEYGNHLQFLLREKEKQCLSYEKRIQELEQRLSTQYSLGQNFTGSKDRPDSTISAVKSGDCKSEISGEEEAHVPYTSTEPMDEVSFTSASSDTKIEQLFRQSAKAREGVDENMCDSSGVLNPQLDSSMLETHEGLQVTKDGENKAVDQLSLEREASSVVGSMSGPLSMVPCDTVEEPSSNSKVEDNLILELQMALAKKSDECTEAETKFEDVMEEVLTLRRELEISKKLLDESQMNCAHLENCLHEAREETHTQICASERRSSEYNALRASAVKMQGLFDRLRDCVTVSGGIAKFVDSFRDLADSFNKHANETQEDGLGEFRKCIQVLADRVSVLSQHRAELRQRSLRAEEYLKKEVEEKHVLKNLYAKHQLEKQASKEKISFGRFEVHEIAAFVLNYAGHYEAINRNCSNYYLSTESVALFVEQQPNQPRYIIGQIVHIERQIVKAIQAVDQGDHRSSIAGTPTLTRGSGSTSNPYGLPMGSEYFIVTIAMLPDTTIHSATPS